MEDKDNTQIVFWTGGFDSTFVVMDCLSKGYKVQPVYIHKNIFYANAEIRNAIFLANIIVEKYPFGKNLLPLQVVNFKKFDLKDVPAEIQKAWEYVYIDKFHIKKDDALIKRRGFQYIIFAQLASLFPNAMLGITKGAKIRQLLETEGNLKYKDKTTGYLTKENCNPYLYTLFGNYQFPIITVYERDMIHIAEKKNFIPVLQYSKFCYSGMHFKEPCGCCIPCQTKLEYGIYEFFSLEGYARAKTYEALAKEKKYYNNIPLSYHFHEYCIAKAKNPNFTSPQLAVFLNLPIGIINDFEKRLECITIDENTLKILGKWCFK